MNEILDAGVQFIQVGLLLVLILLTFGLRARIKALEDKLNSKK